MANNPGGYYATKLIDGEKVVLNHADGSLLMMPTAEEFEISLAVMGMPTEGVEYIYMSPEQENDWEAMNCDLNTWKAAWNLAHPDELLK